MKVFISVIFLSTLFISAFSQTPSPTSCQCDTYAPGNYTNSAGTGCVKEDNVCYSCINSVCTCFKDNVWCDALQDLAEGLATAFIIIIVIAVVCGLCCIGGIIYCICAGALCCAAAAQGSRAGGGAQMTGGDGQGV